MVHNVHESEPTTLPQDVAFDLLNSSRRRFVIRRLHEANEPVELSDLAASLAAEENDVPVDDLTSQQHKRMYISLYQTHVPRLTDAGAAAYDQDAGTVSSTARTAELITYFHDHAEGRQWPLVYGVIGLAGIVFYPFAIVTEITLVSTIGIVFFALILLLSLVHFRYANRSKPS